MHTLTMPLITTMDDRRLLDKRIRLLWQIHNHLVRHMNHRLNALARDRKYIDLRSELAEVRKALRAAGKAAKPDRGYMRTLNKREKAVTDAMNARRDELGISKSACEHFVSEWQKRNRTHLSSQQVQKEADDLWTGVEKVLFGSGRHLHFKKLQDMATIRQKASTNGVKYVPSTGTVIWLGVEMPVRFGKDRDGYIRRSMDHKLKYCILKRRHFRNGDRWYVTFLLDGDAPKKVSAGNGRHGIDPGMSTMCAVSEERIEFHELAPRCKDYNRRIAREQRLIDKQIRQANPGNYNEDGTARKGRHKWVITKGCRRRKAKVRDLLRRKAEYTVHSHNHILNRLLASGSSFVVEAMNYKALARRAGNAVRQDKLSAVTDKHGRTKQVRKYKRRKRFGTSVHDRAPAKFLARAKMKAAIYGGSYQEVDTKSFKASRFDHTTGEYHQIPLSQRRKMVGGHMVLRDPYSAFLLFCSDLNGKHADVGLCNYYFENFLRLQDDLIARTGGSPHPASFGY